MSPNTNWVSPYLLHKPELHPVRPSGSARDMGKTVVFSPHPDDESLGCGGLLALLAQEKVAPEVVIMTDGARSHPKSIAYNGARLSALRENEAHAAITTLGVTEDAIHFLRLGDGQLPAPGDETFMEVATKIRILLMKLMPDTLLVPWRRDPHTDHRATWRLVRVAALNLSLMPRWLEYPVWAWTQVHSKNAPESNEGNALRIDITAVQAIKQRAIAEYQSQLGFVINDDPSGFVLEPQLLAHFTKSWELFISPHHV